MTREHPKIDRSAPSNIPVEEQSYHADELIAEALELEERAPPLPPVASALVRGKNGQYLENLHNVALVLSGAPVLLDQKDNL